MKIYLRRWGEFNCWLCWHLDWPLPLLQLRFPSTRRHPLIIGTLGSIPLARHTRLNSILIFKDYKYFEFCI